MALGQKRHLDCLHGVVSLPCVGPLLANVLFELDEEQMPQCNNAMVIVCPWESGSGTSLTLDILAKLRQATLAGVCLSVIDLPLRLSTTIV
jgi:hypothetical protein